MISFNFTEPRVRVKINEISKTTYQITVSYLSGTIEVSIPIERWIVYHTRSKENEIWNPIEVKENFNECNE